MSGARSLDFIPSDYVREDMQVHFRRSVAENYIIRVRAKISVDGEEDRSSGGFSITIPKIHDVCCCGLGSSDRGGASLVLQVAYFFKVLVGGACALRLFTDFSKEYLSFICFPKPPVDSYGQWGLGGVFGCGVGVVGSRVRLALYINYEARLIAQVVNAKGYRFEGST